MSKELSCFVTSEFVVKISGNGPCGSSINKLINLRDIKLGTPSTLKNNMSWETSFVPPFCIAVNGKLKNVREIKLEKLITSNFLLGVRIDLTAVVALGLIGKTKFFLKILESCKHIPTKIFPCLTS